MERFYYGNKLQFGSLITKKGDVRRQAQVLGPLECAIANKLTWHNTERGKGNPPTSAMGTEVSMPSQPEGNHKFKLNGELLHGGKGKDHTLIHVCCDHHDIPGHHMDKPHTGGLEGLQLPQLETTGGAVHGADKNKCEGRTSNVDNSKKGNNRRVTNIYTKNTTPPKCIKTQCAPPDGHSHTQQQGSSKNGQLWAVQHAQESRGPGMKCGRRWLADIISVCVVPEGTGTFF